MATTYTASHRGTVSAEIDEPAPTYGPSARGEVGVEITGPPPIYGPSARGRVGVAVSEPEVPSVLRPSGRGTLGVSIAHPAPTTNRRASGRGALTLTIREPLHSQHWHIRDGVRRPLRLRTSLSGAVRAGALPIGTTTYAIPTSGAVMYVDPVAGNDSNSGTLLAPKRTAKAASEAIKASGTPSQPATVVLRGGVYHEGSYQPGNGRTLRWQAYPGETVWFDGSVVATSWTSNGDGTWWTPYTAPEIAPLGNDILMDDPNGHLPDMAFLDGAELLQIADGAKPNASQFSVDRTANRLTIGVNPAGREVRYSDIAWLLFSGSRIDMLGIGFRRYRCVGNALHTGLYYGGTSENMVIENCHFYQMGRNALYIGKNGIRVTKCTFKKMNQTAILVGTSDGVIIERSYFSETIMGKWQPQPTSGAVKLTVARRSIVRHNRFEKSHKGNQLWHDVYCTQALIYGNHVDGLSADGTTYSDTGINYEEADGGLWDGVQYRSLIVGNTVVNCRKGIVINAAGWVTAANNTVHAVWNTSAGAQGILLLQDRDASDERALPLSVSPRWTVMNEIVNNRIRPQANGWQFLAYDNQGFVPRPIAMAHGLGTPSGGQLMGGEMFSRLEGNWFSPATGGTTGSTMALIGRAADNTRITRNTPAALATTNVEYGLSSANVRTNYQSATDPATQQDHDTGAPIPAAWAELLGLPTGSRYVGNPLPIPALEES